MFKQKVLHIKNTSERYAFREASVTENTAQEEGVLPTEMATLKLMTIFSQPNEYLPGDAKLLLPPNQVPVDTREGAKCK